SRGASPRRCGTAPRARTGAAAFPARRPSPTRADPGTRRRRGRRARRARAAAPSPGSRPRGTRGSWRSRPGSAIVRRRAAAHGGQQRPLETEAVATVDRRRLVRESDGVEGAEEEGARLVAREDAARPVAAVGRGREADDQDERAALAERRDGTGPVP